MRITTALLAFTCLFFFSQPASAAETNSTDSSNKKQAYEALVAEGPVDGFSSSSALEDMRYLLSYYKGRDSVYDEFEAYIYRERRSKEYFSFQQVKQIFNAASVDDYKDACRLAAVFIRAREYFEITEDQEKELAKKIMPKLKDYLADSHLNLNLAVYAHLVISNKIRVAILQSADDIYSAIPFILARGDTATAINLLDTLGKRSQLGTLDDKDRLMKATQALVAVGSYYRSFGNDDKALFSLQLASGYARNLSGCPYWDYINPVLKPLSVAANELAILNDTAAVRNILDLLDSYRKEYSTEECSDELYECSLLASRACVAIGDTSAALKRLEFLVTGFVEGGLFEYFQDRKYGYKALIETERLGGSVKEKNITEQHPTYIITTDTVLVSGLAEYAYKAFLDSGIYMGLDSLFLQPFTVTPVSRFPARIELIKDAMAGYEGHDDFGDFRELILEMATERFGEDAQQLVPWLNLKAESHINRVKLGRTWREGKSLRPSVELLEKAEKILIKHGAGKDHPAMLRIKGNMASCWFLMGEYNKAEETLKQLIPALEESEYPDSLTLGLCYELIARCKLNVKHDGSEFFRDMSIREDSTLNEVYFTWLNSFNAEPEREYALKCLEESRFIIDSTCELNSMELAHVLELIEPLYYEKRRMNDFIRVLEQRAYIYYDHSYIDEEFSVYPLCEMLYKVVEPELIVSRIVALKKYQAVVPYDRYIYFKDTLTDVYQALLQNMEEGVNMDFISRRWPDGY